jgi:hypothetical protein
MSNCNCKTAQPIQYTEKILKHADSAGFYFVVQEIDHRTGVTVEHRGRTSTTKEIARTQMEEHKLLLNKQRAKRVALIKKIKDLAAKEADRLAGSYSERVAKTRAFDKKLDDAHDAAARKALAVFAKASGLSVEDCA